MAPSLSDNDIWKYNMWLAQGIAEILKKQGHAAICHLFYFIPAYIGPC